MSKNVFADMGMENPEDLLLKTQLVLAIRNMVKEQNISQYKVAELAGMHQPHVSRLLKGITKDISVEKLLGVGAALGYRVTITKSPTDDPKTSVSYELARQLIAA